MVWQEKKIRSKFVSLAADKRADRKKLEKKENSTLKIKLFCYLCRPKNKTMARVCQVTGKRPITGNKVSHSNIKTKRRFLPNLQTKRYFLAEEDKWVTLKVSSEAIRTINKNGLFSVVKQLRAAGEKI
jgi:large subunit ribosomal protein L28